MKIRITIDTDEAATPLTVETGTPFSLYAHQDDGDDTTSDQPLLIGSEHAILGDDIPEMLHGFMLAWANSAILDRHGIALPRTEDEWRSGERGDQCGHNDQYLTSNRLVACHECGQTLLPIEN